MLEDARAQVFDALRIEVVHRFARKVVRNLQVHDIPLCAWVKLLSVGLGKQDFIQLLFNSHGAQMFPEKGAEAT